MASKRTDELVRRIAAGSRPRLQIELGHWIEHRPRFRDFVYAHETKIRKKLSTRDEEARLDVRAELLVAYALLADRRFEAVFEAYGAGQAAPDLSVSYRANQRFNVEVTRVRGVDNAPTKLPSVIAAKLRQLPPDCANVLVVVPGALVEDQELQAALRSLKLRIDQRDDAFFAQRNLSTAHDAHARYLRLSGVLALDETAPQVAFAANPEGRHPLTKEALGALLNTLAAARA